VLISEEVKGLVRAAYDRAREILEKNRTTLDAITEALLEKETINREELREIVESSTA